jgi:hypothetical protein
VYPESQHFKNSNMDQTVNTDCGSKRSWNYCRGNKVFKTSTFSATETDLDALNWLRKIIYFAMVNKNKNFFFPLFIGQTRLRTFLIP